VLLLDTHSWIWVVEGQTRRVGRRTRQLVTRAEAQYQVRLSPISIFEVMALHTAGRVEFATRADHWLAAALSGPGIRLAELTPSIAVDAGAVPRDALPDPIDRILTATARQLGAVFVTGDESILDYAKRTGTLRVHDVRS